MIGNENDIPIGYLVTMGILRIYPKNVSKELWDYLLNNQVKFTTEFLTHSLNMQTDGKSRNLKSPYKRRSNPQIFSQIVYILFEPSIVKVFVEAAVRCCFSKQMFLTFRSIHRKAPVLESFLNKTSAQVFSFKYCEILRTAQLFYRTAPVAASVCALATKAGELGSSCILVILEKSVRIASLLLLLLLLLFCLVRKVLVKVQQGIAHLLIITPV